MHRISQILLVVIGLLLAYIVIQFGMMVRHEYRAVKRKHRYRAIAVEHLTRKINEGKLGSVQQGTNGSKISTGDVPGRGGEPDGETNI